MCMLKKNSMAPTQVLKIVPGDSNRQELLIAEAELSIVPGGENHQEISSVSSPGVGNRHEIVTASQKLTPPQRGLTAARSEARNLKPTPTPERENLGTAHLLEVAMPLSAREDQDPAYLTRGCLPISRWVDTGQPPETAVCTEMEKRVDAEASALKGEPLMADACGAGVRSEDRSEDHDWYNREEVTPRSAPSSPASPASIGACGGALPEWAPPVECHYVQRRRYLMPRRRLERELIRRHEDPGPDDRPLTRLRGQVVDFNVTTGAGFLKDETTGRRLQVHREAVRRPYFPRWLDNLHVEETVEYTPVEGPRGWWAAVVTRPGMSRPPGWSSKPAVIPGWEDALPPETQLKLPPPLPPVSLAEPPMTTTQETNPAIHIYVTPTVHMGRGTQSPRAEGPREPPVSARPVGLDRVRDQVQDAHDGIPLWGPPLSPEARAALLKSLSVERA